MKAMAIFGWLVLVALSAIFAVAAWFNAIMDEATSGSMNDMSILVLAGISLIFGILAWLGRPTKWNKNDEVKK